MNVDEKLRDILRAEADGIEPSPAGWDRIRETIAVRRRRRTWLRGSMAAAAALSLIAVVAVVYAPDRDDRGADDVRIATQPATPSPADPAPPADPDAAIGVWPLTTQAEVDAWRQDPSTHPYLSDIDTAADAFAREYLGILKPVVRTPPPGEDASARYISRAVEGSDRQLAVTKVTFASAAPYTAVAAQGGSIDVTSIGGDTVHGSSAAVSSPMTVAGSFAGVDQPIDVALRVTPPVSPADADSIHGEPATFQTIAVARAEIGPDGWMATLTFRTTAKTGTLLVTTYSNADGGLADAYALPVTLGDGANAPVETPRPPRPEGAYPAEFVAIERGRVAVFDTKTGKRVRFITDELPGGGASDPFVTDGGKSVVYVQGEGTCAASIRRFDFATGRSTVVVPASGDRVPSSPVVSARGELAYVATNCAEGAAGDSTLIVGAKQIPTRPDDHATILDLAWAPDGDRIAVLAAVCCGQTNAAYVVEPAKDQVVTDGERIAAGEGSCRLTDLTYTLDNRVLAAEGCVGQDDGDPRTTRIRDLSDAKRRVVLEVQGSEWFETVSIDRTGDHLLLEVLTCEETCDHAPTAVHRFSVDGEPLPVASDLTQPVWLP